MAINKEAKCSPISEDEHKHVDQGRSTSVPEVSYRTTIHFK